MERGGKAGAVEEAEEQHDGRRVAPVVPERERRAVEQLLEQGHQPGRSASPQKCICTEHVGPAEGRSERRRLRDEPVVAHRKQEHHLLRARSAAPH